MEGRFTRFRMVYAFIFNIALLLAVWAVRWVRNDRKFWENYTSMYDCSSDSIVQQESVLYLPRHDFGVCESKRLIDFKKYENWLRCMTVTRAAYLMRTMNCEWDPFYVYFDNKTGATLLQTTFAALATKPEFLIARPRKIWCSFSGGPPGQSRLIRTSLLNLIVDRIYHHIVQYGVEITDSKIIAALNYVQPLLLEAPCGA